jgi:hypothetical protein
VPDKSAERRTAPPAGMISPKSSRRDYKFVEAVVRIAAGSPLTGAGEERGGPNTAALRSSLPLLPTSRQQDALARNPSKWVDD